MCCRDKLTPPIVEGVLNNFSRLKTGQLVSYSDYDDNYYEKGYDRNFTRDDIQEIVIDNVTGLMWQDNIEVKTVTKTEDKAELYCQNLSLGGYDDWVLPTINEAMSILDNGKYPTLNSIFQNSTISYWTSTDVAQDTNSAWKVYYDAGSTVSTGAEKLESLENVRCVRNNSNITESEYIRDNEKEIVIDTTTNLVWQDNSDAKTIEKNWEDALNYCQTLDLGGYTNWTLPNFNELYYLSDKSKFNPSIDGTFANVISEQYWSSTTSNNGAVNAFTVNFYNSKRRSGYKLDLHNIRCVTDLN